MSNMGDMGDMGDVGVIAAAGAAAAGGAILPDRVDLPFVDETAETLWVRDNGGNWTQKPLGRDLKDLRIPIATWPEREWSAQWAAWLVLAEFASSGWQESITLAELWDPSSEPGEIAYLIKCAEDERADALGEIIAQDNTYEDFMAYFLGLLKMKPSSYPKTFQLLHVAGLVGILVAIFFKKHPCQNHQDASTRAARARPSQVCPALMPPVPVPGHPSFPSGHATQAMLMALCVGEAVKNQVSNDVPVWPPLLQTLARRIARNREIAGLHFRSDTKAGFELARKTFDKLSCGHEFRQLLSDAMCEWPSLQHSSAAS